MGLFTPGKAETAKNESCTSFRRNYVREIGIIQKQSSAFFQGKSCLNVVANNVLFNQPRAAVNLNDGMGGGTNITRNAIWNTCRETGDHGPINSWDRQPFLTTVAHGTPSYDAMPSNVSQNLIIANYGASQNIYKTMARNGKTSTRNSQHSNPHHVPLLDSAVTHTHTHTHTHN